MKIALYGMPCAGKSTLMDRITDAKVINGSQELRRICGGSFLELSEEEKHQVRIKYTEYINGLNDEVIDFSKHEYKLAVVFSSSFWGDRYEGTPGSELIVDDAKIITEDDEVVSSY